MAGTEKLIGKSRVVSDGDLDAILASAYLVMAGAVKPEDVEFPPPSRLRGMEIRDAIVVELPPSKGVELRNCVLLDHHFPDGAGRVVYYDAEGRHHVLEEMRVRSVAELVRWWLALAVDIDVLEFEGIVSDIDNGLYPTERHRKLHAAYRFNITSPEMRRFLLEALAAGNVRAVWAWAEEEAAKAAEAGKVAKELAARAEVRGPVAVIYVDAEDRIQMAAMREAMFKLEEKWPVVVAVVRECGKPARLSLATKTPGVDLTGLFERVRGVAGVAGAGGRPNVGGVQLESPDALDAVLDTVVAYAAEAGWKPVMQEA